MTLTAEVEEYTGLYLRTPLFDLSDDQPEPLVKAFTSGASLLLVHRDGRKARLDLAALAEKWTEAK